MDILSHSQTCFNGKTSYSFKLSSLTNSSNPHENIFELLADKPYLPLCTPIIIHILKTKNLSEAEKLHYLTYYALFSIETKYAFIKQSGRALSNILECSEQWIFDIQKSLEQKNYLIITRSKDSQAHHNINQIIPTLPEDCFLDLLEKTENKSSQTPIPNHPEFKTKLGSSADRIRILENQKLFIAINFNLLQFIFSHEKLTSFDKLLWIYSYLKDYTVYRSNLNAQSDWPDKDLLLSVTRLAKLLNKNETSIRRSLHKLETFELITKKLLKVHNQDEYSNRKKQPLFRIKIHLPDLIKTELKNLDNRKSQSIRNNQKPKTPKLITPPKKVIHTKIPQTPPTNHLVGVHRAEPEVPHAISEASQASGLGLININHNQIPIIKNFSEEPYPSTLPEPNSPSDCEPDLNVFLEKAFRTFESSTLRTEFKRYHETPCFSLQLTKNILDSQLTPEKIGISKSELTLAAIWFYKQNTHTERDQLTSYFKTKLKTPLDPTSVEFQLVQEIQNPTQRFWLNEQTIYTFLPEIEVQEYEFKQCEQYYQKQNPKLPMTVDPEKLVTADTYHQIKTWVYRLKQEKSIRGNAKLYDPEELIAQIAYHVRTWVPQTICYDTDHFKIYVACKMLREGTWQVPHNLVKSREMELKMENAGYQWGYLD
jgi:hypothetical protein